MIKNHIINLSVISLFLASYTLSQTTITGRVIDSKTDQPLSGANIVLVGADLGTTSNKEGQYQLSIAEPGEYVLRVSFIGYKEAVRNLSLGQNQKLTVNIQLRPTILRGDIVLVTATKTERRLSEIPGRVEVITQEELKSLPSQKLDDVLKYSSGLNVHRTSGIFEIRPVVSLRGVSGDEPGRTLVLVNGVPINKSDTGVANWNRINVNNIKQVEIFKGAGSSLYGNNAMGGVINIITQTPVEKFSGGANVSYGTYNTLSTNFNLSMRKNDKLYFDVDGFYRRSDGYIDLPDTLKTEYTVPLFLDEKGISAQMGFDLNPTTSVKVLYDYYDDKRGEGEKIEEVDGKHRHFDTHFFQGKFTRRRENSKYELNGFYQYENYLRVDERITKGEYQKFDVASDRVDKGLLFYYLRNIASNHTLIFGFELKSGSVDGGDYYATSPDTVLNRGKMQFLAVYLQDEFGLMDNRLRIIASLRYDKVKFYDGYFHANLEDNPFYTYNGNLGENRWNAYSPRIAARYSLSGNLSGYLSYSKGFRSSILDDLCRSGWMRLGPKVSNPELGPETIDSYEFGFDYSPENTMKISPSFYYSKGNDFLYFVDTGELLWGKKPIYRRENITAVDIYGAEFDFTYRSYGSIFFSGNYTYNQSTISRFPDNPELEGKYLIYSPIHQAKASIQWKNQFINIILGIQYKDRQFTNDDNSEEIGAYCTLDVQIWKVLFDDMKIAVDFQNITNERQTEHIERLSPGRLINIKLSYNW